MSAKCAIEMCKNYTHRRSKTAQKVSYHRLPNDATLRLRWIKIIRKSRKERLWKPNENTVVCSDHFHEIDVYYINSHGCRRLKQTAVPSKGLFLSAPRSEGSNASDEEAGACAPSHSDNTIKESADSGNMEKFSKTLLEMIKHEELLPTYCWDGVTSFDKKRQRAKILQKVKESLGVTHAPNFAILTLSYQRYLRKYVSRELSKRSGDLKKDAVVQSIMCFAPTWVRQVEEKLNLLPQIVEEAIKKRVNRPLSVEKVTRELEQRALLAVRAHIQYGKTPQQAILDTAVDMRQQPEQFHKFWQLCVSSSCACARVLAAAGDLPAAVYCEARPHAWDWAVVDTALLYYEHTLLTEDSLQSYEELSTLTRLFSLVQRFELHYFPTHAKQSWQRALKAYQDSGRVSTLVVLQRRWYELVQRARRATAALRRARAAQLHALVARVAYRFPELMTCALPTWEELLNSGRIAYNHVDEYLEDERAADGPSSNANSGEGTQYQENEDDLILIENDVETVDLALTDNDSDENDKLTIDDAQGFSRDGTSRLDNASESEAVDIDQNDTDAESNGTDAAHDETRRKPNINTRLKDCIIHNNVKKKKNPSEVPNEGSVRSCDSENIIIPVVKKEMDENVINNSEENKQKLPQMILGSNSSDQRVASNKNIEGSISFSEKTIEDNVLPFAVDESSPFALLNLDPINIRSKIIFSDDEDSNSPTDEVDKSRDGRVLQKVADSISAPKSEEILGLVNFSNKEKLKTMTCETEPNVMFKSNINNLDTDKIVNVKTEEPNSKKQISDGEVINKNHNDALERTSNNSQTHLLESGSGNLNLNNIKVTESATSIKDVIENNRRILTLAVKQKRFSKLMMFKMKPDLILPVNIFNAHIPLINVDSTEVWKERAGRGTIRLDEIDAVNLEERCKLDPHLMKGNDVDSYVKQSTINVDSEKKNIDNEADGKKVAVVLPSQDINGLRFETKYDVGELKSNPDFNLRLRDVSDEFVKLNGEMMAACKAVTVDIDVVRPFSIEGFLNLKRKLNERCKSEHGVRTYVNTFAKSGKKRTAREQSPDSISGRTDASQSTHLEDVRRRPMFMKTDQGLDLLVPVKEYLQIEEPAKQQPADDKRSMKRIVNAIAYDSEDELPLKPKRASMANDDRDGDDNGNTTDNEAVRGSDEEIDIDPTPLTPEELQLMLNSISCNTELNMSHNPRKCCRARRDLAYNRARARIAARRGLPPPPHVAIHSCPTAKCRCCCARVLEAARAACPTAAVGARRQLRQYVNLHLYKTYVSTKTPSSSTNKAGEPPSNPGKPSKKKSKKKGKDTEDTSEHAPTTKLIEDEDYASAYAEWRRQRQMHDKYFNLSSRTKHKSNVDKATTSTAPAAAVAAAAAAAHGRGRSQTGRPVGSAALSEQPQTPALEKVDVAPRPSTSILSSIVGPSDVTTAPVGDVIAAPPLPAPAPAAPAPPYTFPSIRVKDMSQLCDMSVTSQSRVLAPACEPSGFIHNGPVLYGPVSVFPSIPVPAAGPSSTMPILVPIAPKPTAPQQKDVPDASQTCDVSSTTSQTLEGSPSEPTGAVVVSPMTIHLDTQQSAPANVASTPPQPDQVITIPTLTICVSPMAPGSTNSAVPFQISVMPMEGIPGTTSDDVTSSAPAAVPLPTSDDSVAQPLNRNTTEITLKPVRVYSASSDKRKLRKEPQASDVTSTTSREVVALEEPVIVTVMLKEPEQQSRPVKILNYEVDDLAHAHMSRTTWLEPQLERFQDKRKSESAIDDDEAPQSDGDMPDREEQISVPLSSQHTRTHKQKFPMPITRVISAENPKSSTTDSRSNKYSILVPTSAVLMPLQVDIAKNDVTEQVTVSALMSREQSNVSDDGDHASNFGDGCQESSEQHDMVIDFVDLSSDNSNDAIESNKQTSDVDDPAKVNESAELMDNTEKSYDKPAELSIESATLDDETGKDRAPAKSHKSVIVLDDKLDESIEKSAKLKLNDKPSETSEVSAKLNDKPSETSEVSAKLNDKPSETSEMSAKLNDKPSETSEVSAKLNDKPSETSEVSAKLNDKPSETSEVSAKLNDKFANSNSNPTKSSDKPAIEEDSSSESDDDIKTLLAKIKMQAKKTNLSAKDVLKRALDKIKTEIDINKVVDGGSNEAGEIVISKDDAASEVTTNKCNKTGEIETIGIVKTSEESSEMPIISNVTSLASTLAPARDRCGTSRVQSCPKALISGLNEIVKSKNTPAVTETSSDLPKTLLRRPHARYFSSDTIFASQYMSDKDPTAVCVLGLGSVYPRFIYEYIIVCSRWISALTYLPFRFWTMTPQRSTQIKFPEADADCTPSYSDVDSSSSSGNSAPRILSLHDYLYRKMTDVPLTYAQVWIVLPELESIPMLLSSGASVRAFNTLTAEALVIEAKRTQIICDDPRVSKEINYALYRQKIRTVSVKPLSELGAAAAAASALFTPAPPLRTGGDSDVITIDSD